MNQMNRNPRRIITTIAVTATLILVMGVLSVYYIVTLPKADYYGFDIALNNFVSNNKDIISIQRLKGNEFRVIVRKNWDISTKEKKLRFCNYVRNSIYKLSNRYHIANKEGKSIHLTFYDRIGTKVAEQHGSDFNILR